MKIISILLLFTSVAASANDLLKSYREEYESLLSKRYSLLPHKGNFLLPISYNNNPNNNVFNNVFTAQEFEQNGEYVEHTEAEFQVSFSVLLNKQLFDSDFNVFVAYTQHSWWQIYNNRWSRPFRESNYAPEIYLRKILDKPINIFGLNLVGFDVGYIHQSNGQIQTISRSWDRLFLRASAVLGSLIVATEFWYRIPETDREDDNPDINQYRSIIDLSVKYKVDKHAFQLIYNHGEKYHGGELAYSYPFKEGLRFYIKTNQGYGQSLQDYDHRVERYGIGFILEDLYTAAKE